MPETQLSQPFINLDSKITLDFSSNQNTDHHPAFVIPQGDFFIHAIGLPESQTADIDTLNIYAENNHNHYLLEMAIQQDFLVSLNFYQNLLTLSPDEEHEWNEHIERISSMTLEFDDFVYNRVSGNHQEVSGFVEAFEMLKSREYSVDCQNQYMLFERLTDSGLIENLKVAIEIVDSARVALIVFYVGFSLPTTSLNFS